MVVLRLRSEPERCSNDDGKDSSWEQEGDSSVATEVEKKVKRPNLYKVLLHNDDYTTMDFVVMVLVTIFHLRESDAVRVMLNVHRQGVGVAGVYSHEVAETKVMKVAEIARQYEFPLRCSLEPA